LNDEKIIELYFSRDESAIDETQKKYGGLCRYIASNFLALPEDREECVNDVLLALWQSIPPEEPENLRAFTAKLTRNRAIAKRRDQNSQGRSEVTIVSDECLDFLDDGTDLLSEYEAKRIGKVISEFLTTVEEDSRDVFILRYFLGMKLEAVAKETGFTLGKVKMSLSRTKKRLREKLRKEGFEL
jgi:RNA polymerase sigma-70 factor (ECF subfamily)